MKYLKKIKLDRLRNGESNTIYSRRINLDILKIIACFLVIVNHTNSRIFLSLEPSITWFLSLTYFFICKVAVPIFIMCSGAVLLGKQESYKDVFKKRIFKILIVIVLFSFLYYINDIVVNSKSFSLVTFFYNIWQNNITNAYWYLYMYLGLLLMLPILRKLVKNMEKKDYFYMLVIWLMFIGIIPILTNYLNIKPISKNFQIQLFTTHIVYFLLGYFIENKLEAKHFSKKNAIILVILSILCIVISVGLTYYEYICNGKVLLFMDNLGLITIAIPTITLFYICKQITLKLKHRINSESVAKISINTFGIYLLSDLLIEKLDYVYIFLTNYTHKLLAIVILENVVFIVGYIITWILKKIPGIKKLI